QPADHGADEAVFFYSPAQPFRDTVTGELRPGEQTQSQAELDPHKTFVAHYTVFPGLGDDADSIDQLQLQLDQSFVERTGGHVDLNPKLDTRSPEDATQYAGDVQAIPSADGHSVDVRWLRPAVKDGQPAVTGYQLWTRQALGPDQWKLYEDGITGE